MEKAKKVKVKRTGIEKLIVLTVWLLFLTQKIAFTVSSFSFPFALFIFPIFFIFLLCKGRIKVSFSRCCFYVFFIIMALLSSFLNMGHFSLPSLLLLILIYIFLIFDYDLKENERETIVKSSRNVLVVFACLGILQFAVQFVGLPFIDPFLRLPDSLRLLGFNNTYSITYGSDIMKANGMIFLEPSFFSQFMAIGIILEFFSKKLTKSNYIRIAIYLLAIVASFSGTGIVILVFTILPYFFIKRVKHKFTFILIFLIALIVLMNTKYGDMILSRVTEISGTRTSGAMRFVNPLIETFSSSNKNLFVGNGAGSTSTNVFELDVNFNALLKVCYEYGLMTLAFFIVLVIKYFFKNKVSLLTISLFIMYLVLSGNLLSPTMVFLLVVLLESEEKRKKYVLVEESSTQISMECAWRHIFY